MRGRQPGFAARQERRHRRGDEGRTRGRWIVSRLDPIDLGTDEDSETITSCVVVPVEGEPLPSTKKSRREPASLRTFRDAFTEALINGGKTTHVPAMAR